METERKVQIAESEGQRLVSNNFERKDYGSAVSHVYNLRTH